MAVGESSPASYVAKIKIATVMSRAESFSLSGALFFGFQQRAEWAHSGSKDPLSGRYGHSAVKLQEHKLNCIFAINPVIATCGGYD